jgi:collagen type I alpha
MATITWTFTTSGDWNTAANWSGKTVPSAGDDAVISLPGAYQITVPDVTVNSITLNDSAAELLVTGTLDVTTDTAIGAGTLTIGQSESTALGFLTNTGTIVDDGTLALSSKDGASLSRIGGSGDLTANVTIDNTGSSLDLQSLGSLNVVVLQGTIQGGAIQIDRDLSVGSLSQFGSLTLDNVQLDGTTSFDLDFGALTTNNGLTFAGDGGTGIGTLFYSSINTLPGTFQINGTQTFDMVMIDGAGGEMNVTGNLTLASGATLVGEPQSRNVSINLQGTGCVDSLGTITGAAIDIGVSAFSNSGLIEAIFQGMPGPSENTGIGLLSGSIDNLASGTIVSLAGGIEVETSRFANSGLIETATGGTLAAIQFLQSAVDNLAGGIIRSSVGTITFSQGTVDNMAGAAIQSAGGTIAFAANNNLTNDGTIGSTGGSVDIAAILSGSGTTTIEGKGVVEIENAAGSAQALDFLGAGTLKLDKPTFVPSVINGFSRNDAIILGVSATAVSYTSGDLKMQLGGGQTFDLGITGSHALSDFIVSTGSASTTINLACFAAGTRIATTRGQVPVERLHEGDDVIVESTGRSLPIRWIGYRKLNCTRHSRPQAVWPIRVAADAFGPEMPARDLYLSPDHAVFADGVLVPVKYLINGSTISQVHRSTITYYHIELARHAVLLAEGLPAESLLPSAGRSAFTNGGEPMALHPDFHSRAWEADGCAPLVVSGAALQHIRARLSRSAMISNGSGLPYTRSPGKIGETRQCSPLNPPAQSSARQSMAST